MGLEQNNEQHYREVVDKFVDPAAALAMTTRDYVVRPSANGVTGAIIITLPEVAEAKGRFYSIVARAADAVNTITITDNNDSECWLGDIVLDGKCDKMLFYSDGLCWHTLCCGAGPGAFPGFDTTAAPGTTDPPTTAVPTTTAVPSTFFASTTAVPTTEPQQGGATTAAPTTAAATTVAPTTGG